MKGGGVLSSIQSYFFEVPNLGFYRLGHGMALEHCLNANVASVFARRTVINMFTIFWAVAN